MSKRKKGKNKSHAGLIVATTISLILLAGVLVFAFVKKGSSQKESAREIPQTASVDIERVDKDVIKDEDNKDISPFYEAAVNGHNAEDEVLEEEPLENPGENPQGESQENSQGNPQEEPQEKFQEGSKEGAQENPQEKPIEEPQNSQGDKKPKGPVTVACVGDSITYGDGVEDKKTQSYPAYLSELLGGDNKVYNFGHNGATLSDSGDLPYRRTDEYRESLDQNADIYVIMLGTNDTKPENWKEGAYERELSALVDEYMSLPSKPKIILMVPPTAFPRKGEAAPDYGINDSIIRNQISPSVGKVMNAKDTYVVDLYAYFMDHPDLYTDGIHPGAAGNLEIARQVCGVINGF